MADEIQNIKIRFVADADFSDLDQSLQKLTSEEKALKDQLKGVDQAAKEAGKSISDETNKATTAVNQTNKSFAGLKDQVKGLASQLPGAFQVQQILGFAKGMQGATAATGGLSGAMNVLKVAIASTGIGALVIAIVSLISYFKQTDEGATQLEGVMGGLGAVIKRITGFLAEMGSWLFNAVSSVENFQDALKDLGDFIIQNVINRFKAILVYGEAIQKLFEGDFSGAAKKAADALIQVNTGIENGTDKLAEWGKEIAEASKRAYEFALAMDAINDKERELSVQTAEVEKKVTNLMIQAKNRSLSEKERVDLYKEANKLEEENIDQVITNEKKRLALLQQRNKDEQDAINQKLNADIKAAKSEEERQALMKKRLSITDDLADEEAQQIIKITRLETESANLRERNQNKIDALLEQGRAKREAAAKKEADDLKKINEKLIKENEDIYKRDVDAWEKYQLLKITEGVKAQDEISKDEKRSEEERIDAINKRIQQEIKLLEKEKEFIIKDKKLTDNEIFLLDEQFRDKTLDVVKKGEKEKEDIHAKTEENNTKKTEEEQKKRDAAYQKGSQAFATAANLVSEIGNGFFNLRKEQRTQETAELQAKEEAELKRAGDNAQAQAVIKNKYAKQEAELKRKQAQSDKDQAIFNILISTAVNTVKALGTPPAPNLVAAALAASLGGIQLAFAASKPIPKFNRGTKSVPGYDTGDDSIVAMLRPGEGVMPVDRMKDYQPAFNAIFDRKVPAELLNSFVSGYGRMDQMISTGSSNELGSLKSELKALNKKLDKLQILQVNMDQKGFKTYLSSENSKSQIENNYLRV